MVFGCDLQLVLYLSAHTNSIIVSYCVKAGSSVYHGRLSGRRNKCVYTITQYRLTAGKSTDDRCTDYTGLIAPRAG